MFVMLSLLAAVVHHDIHIFVLIFIEFLYIICSFFVWQFCVLLSMKAFPEELLENVASSNSFPAQLWSILGSMH